MCYGCQLEFLRCDNLKINSLCAMHVKMNSLCVMYVNMNSLCVMYVKVIFFYVICCMLKCKLHNKPFYIHI